MRNVWMFVLAIALVASSAAQQSNAPKENMGTSQENAVSVHHRTIYSGLTTILMRSAEVMPEENYSFRPVETVRTYGQIIGHLADAQYFFCSTALGEKNPGLKIEKTKTTKAELVAALKDAIAYCDKAYAGMTDAKATERVDVMGNESPRIGALTVNLIHSAEHYGNLVTYMRMKGLLPPSSDPAVMQQLQPKKSEQTNKQQ